MDDLIKYLDFIRKVLENEVSKIPIQIIMEEISQISIENWMENGDPTLTTDQLNVALLRTISRNITLN